MSDVRDGINTVLVVMVDGHGQRQVAKQAFFASAPLVSKDDKREPKLPVGIRHVTGMPAKVESRALIVPRKERSRAFAKATENARPAFASALVAHPSRTA
jgi:hypothetical protein